MFDLVTHGQPTRAGITGRFNWILDAFHSERGDHTTFGGSFGGSIREIYERIEAEYTAIGITDARLTVWGPYYAANRLPPAPTTCTFATEASGDEGGN